MSKKINVNPGQYKVAGRERPGEDIVQEDHRQEYAQNKVNQRQSARSPGQPSSGAASKKNKR